MPRCLALLVALALAGCSAVQTPDERKLGSFTVDFSWEGVPPCSNVSPRIEARGAPPGTTRFRVELVDVDSAISRHGGGEVPADPGGIIPAGALKNYRGPCPSQRDIAYEMRVSALDPRGQVLAYAADRQTYKVTSLIRRSRR